METQHTLSNGYTYLAITCGLAGSWAKATDPITAIEKAQNHTYMTRKKNVIYVVYAKSEKTHCGDIGGYSWDRKYPPLPIGIFTVTGKGGNIRIKPFKVSIKTSKSESVSNCLTWVESEMKKIEDRVNQDRKLGRENGAVFNWLEEYRANG